MIREWRLNARFERMDKVTDSVFSEFSFPHTDDGLCDQIGQVRSRYLSRGIEIGVENVIESLKVLKMPDDNAVG